MEDDVLSNRFSGRLLQMRLAPAMLILAFALPGAAQDPERQIYLASDDPRDELATALSVEMPGWGIVRGPAPQGMTPLERASAAQVAARDAGARVAIWTETGPEGGSMVRAVEVAGDSPRHAPLPQTLAAVDARTFAAVASSLVDEVRAPPTPIRVRVRVEVEGENIVVDQGSATVTANGASATAAVPNAQAPIIVVEPEIVEPPVQQAPVEQAPVEEAPIEVDLPETNPDAEVIVSPGPARPQEDTAEENPRVWFGADFAPFVGSSSRFRGRETRTLSGGLIGAYSGAIEGLGLSLGVNITRNNMRGAAVAVGGNIAGGDVEGVQVASGFNWANNVRGIQLSTGLNVARGRLDGVQASSGVNFARGGRGLQVGMVNVSRGELQGLQLGLVNVTEGNHFSAGLINVVRGGRTHIELSANSEGFGFSTLKHGADHWHYLYSVGGRPFGDEPSYSLGFGLGARITPTQRLFFDIDGIVHYISDGDHGNEGSEVLAQARLQLGIKLFERLALVAGLTLNALGTYNDDSDYGHFGVDLSSEECVGTCTDTWRVRGYPGLVVGVQIL